MTLAELLESRFRGDIRFRGTAYLKAERVAVTRVTPDHVFAVVRDGVEYETQLSREEEELKMYCNCAPGTHREATCKHLWATILAVDEGGYLTETPKAGNVPPFVQEVTTTPINVDDWGDDSGSDVFRPPGPSAQPRGDAAAPQQSLRPWETELQELRSEMESSGPVDRTAGREREIHYEIDLDQSRSCGQLVVQTSQRQRRTNGQWGKLKPLKLRPGKFDDVENEDDARILAFLAGGTPERTNWYAQQSEIQTAVYRYRVGHELCELILPLMCGTGRVRYLDASGKQPALAWDDGDPWELSVKVVFDKSESLWRLEGWLVRGEINLPISKTQLLIPGGLVLHQEKISRLRDFNAFDWVRMLERNEAVSVPADEAEDLVDQLLDMPTLPRLDLPDELKLEEVECEPIPRLTVRSPKQGRWHFERLRGEIAFDYQGTFVGGSSAQWAIVQRDKGRCLIRNRRREDEAWNQLQEKGFRRLLDRRRGASDVEIAARDLGPAVRLLVGEGWQIHADGKQVRQAGKIGFQVKSGIDWFELHADISFEGRTVSFPELLSSLARGDSTVRLDDGSWGIIPEEWLERFGLLAGLGVAEDDHVRFSASQVAMLDALLSAQETVDYDEKFRELRDLFNSFSGIKSADEPEGFQGELRGYQKQGLGWLGFLQQFGFGGCLADDMGLGKTVQMLALLLERSTQSKKPKPSLIVVPKSLMFNWRQECERFTPKLTVLEYSGVDRATLRAEFEKHDVVLTTYGTLRRDILELKETQFDYIILDEAQTIKNAGSQVAKASRLLSGNHRIALSGTPVENHLSDLWSIFEFLNPGILGRSSLFRNYAAQGSEGGAHKNLARGLRPFILRRTKAQVASELPRKIEQTIYCDMGADQQRLYLELRDHYRDSLLGIIEEKGLEKSKMHVLEALLRLRQAACHPALLDKSSPEQSSAKLDVLCPHIEELIAEGHKALVFSQFTSMLSIVKKHLDERNIVYEYLDGKTRNRQECVERFQNDADCGVFLISLKAGGLGLNLTAADYVFLLDPWWNPAVETQAIDRAHRVGQTRPVFAYRLIVRNTVEEKIAELQGQKRKLADEILEADTSLLRDLSTDDLKLLLS